MPTRAEISRKNGKKGGRPKGSLDKVTLEKNKVEKVLHQRILKNTDRIFNSQLQIAEGCSYLYKIHTDSKGKKSKPELVTSQIEITEYLEGEYDKNIDYYYITTEKPDIRAIDSMYNRVFGKPKESVDVTTGGKPISGFNYIAPNEANDKTAT